MFKKTGLEIERKFLLEFPDLNLLKESFDVRESHILQTYLTENETGVERRIRKITANGHTKYFYTEKVKISELERQEEEKEITLRKFAEYLLEEDTNLKPIVKIRYYFEYRKQTLELDVYNFSTDKATLEIELESKDTYITLPEELKVIREVTEDSRYKNKNLAKYHTLDFE